MKIAPALATTLAALTLSACGGMSEKGERSSLSGPIGQARLAPTQGNNANGSVRFTPVAGGVRVQAQLESLTPGPHGFHLHEKGDCSAPDATSAGGHFNPANQPHGHPDRNAHHLGDLPMVVADQNGRGTLDYVAKGATLDSSSSTGIVGRAAVLHAAADDFTSQPAGNSGARIACGVISLTR